MKDGTGRLSGCTALVTGGLGGIGQAVAKLFAREGAQVWVADLVGEDSERSAAVRGISPAIRYVKLDVTMPDDWKTAARHFPNGLDILVNNAGIAPTGAIGVMEHHDWHRVMTVNATSAFHALTHLGPALGQAGRANGRWASVVNVSSILANVGIAQAGAYAASKGALRSFTKTAAIEFAQSGQPIRVNSIHPGFARTEMTQAGNAAMSDDGNLLDALAAETPMGRIAEPEEIANAILFLASHESSFMTGTELTVDGGWSAR
ncbi:SDR family oxidoreductase [Croceicoccus ponticola]|uniref:SDR family oxidoreductase n=1 Tax=Croceicoccus ponticola TaxID=2217664 RepID=A0A437GVS2_9SPHN|nr:SDR family oxidoreductase [Croceicoccus ponticola]RVQ64599.1 SDR family oxidoreductase [Croceicoccus ponticola]